MNLKLFLNKLNIYFLKNLYMKAVSSFVKEKLSVTFRRLNKKNYGLVHAFNKKGI